MKFNFEQAIAELERLISGLEQDNVSLEDSIKASERASKLIIECEKYLSQCQGKLEMLKKEDGVLKAVPFEEEEENESELL